MTGDQRFKIVLEAIRAVKQIVLALIIASGSIGFAWVGIYWPVSVSHGETTIISVAYDFVTNLKLHVVLPYVWGAAASVGWYRERDKRIRDRAQQDQRIRQFEIGKDPNVTSSGLDPAGNRTVEKGHG